MDVYYLNHLNEKLFLNSETVILQYQELFDYSWNARTDNGNITSFEREMATYPVTVTVTADSDEEFAEILNNFHSIVEKDIVNHTPGQLYIGEQYLTCYISGDIKKDAFMGVPIQVKNLTIVTDHPFWIQEESRSFQTSMPSEGLEAYLDYEYGFDYDYTMPYGSDLIWRVDHFASCEFLMTVFGPVIDPLILINGHPYQVYVTLEENEYLQIDSRNNTVVKYSSDGIRQDVYDLRSKQQSVFDTVTPGNIKVVWSGNFGFDITLYCERSEPKWKIKDS